MIFQVSVVGFIVKRQEYEKEMVRNMKRKWFIASLLAVASLAASAQAGLKRVYDEDINPVEQIELSLVRAKADGKFVVCQVGGNWCPWCLRFADFIASDSTISRLIADNFVYAHVNYNPGKAEGEVRTRQAEEVMRRLGNPGRFGFPVFVVLDENGRVLHTQDSSFLEEGKGYSQEKTLRFFKNWTPGAVKGK